jgi:hypothetical protein
MENWRTETTAMDFFNTQKKKLSIADRRPVIRQASDLVGPGIAAAATLVTDWSDTLATYNGFYSSDIGAFDAPNSTSQFVGTVVMDSAFGGVQTLYPLDQDGAYYQRTFLRNPGDADTIYWQPWVLCGAFSTPFLQLGSGITTVPTGGALTPLLLGAVDTDNSSANYADYFSVASDHITVLKPGIYSVAMEFYRYDAISWDTWSLNLPSVSGSPTVVGQSQTNNVGSSFITAPFRTNGSGINQIQVVTAQSSGAGRDVLAIVNGVTRIGDL